MSLLLSSQIDAMREISPEVYEVGKGLRDYANVIQSAGTKTVAPIGLLHQIVMTSRVDPRLWEFCNRVRDTLNARGTTGKKQPALTLSQQLLAMRNISEHLYDWGYQLQRFVNAL